MKPDKYLLQMHLPGRQNIAGDFIRLELHHCSLQDALLIHAARINTQRAFDLARTFTLVDVPVKAQQRLVLLDHFEHSVAAY